ncbi:S8/S53 family peptidase [Deinococcus sp. PEB2-63]
MNRALTAFLIALFLSVAHAVNIKDIYPSRVAPGGLLQVTLAEVNGQPFDCQKNPLMIWIGSTSFKPTCEMNGRQRFLVVTLPTQAAQLPQMGPQVLRVLRVGERPTPGSPSLRNVQILDQVTGVLSVRSPSTTPTGGTSEGTQQPGDTARPESLASVLSSNRTDSAAITQARTNLQAALEDSSTENYKLPGSQGVCGSTLYSTRLGSQVLQQQVGLLIDEAEDAGLWVAPDTAKQPPVDTVFWTDLSSEQLNEYAWKAIHLDSPVTPGTVRPTVYLIDTFDPDATNTDPFQIKIMFNGNEFSAEGHGSKVSELIQTVAPSVETKYVQACNENGSCSLRKVLHGICAAATSAATGKVIVHLSLATPYDHPILHAAVNAALNAGAAVVAAYGNSDRCVGRAGGLLNYCNAYPADWAGGALYSVGASQQSNTTPQTFQRGQPRYTRKGDPRSQSGSAERILSAMPVATQPSLSAPGFFFLPLTDQRRPASDAKPYWGTSFAAPLVTGALARWVQAGQTGWPQPSALRCGDLRLDLRRISGSC